MLDGEGRCVRPERMAEPIASRGASVTVRIGAMCAARLADRARAAGVSQGAVVAGLLDGMPPSPRALDHASAVAALADSTQKVAAMSADIHAFIRLMRSAQSHEAERYRASLMSLSTDVRLHLEVASRLMAELTPRQRVTVSDATARRDEDAPK